MVEHVLRFGELIDSAVQSITYYLFAYVLSRAWKNNWAVGMTRYVFSLDVAEQQSPEDGNSGRRKDARNTVVTGVNGYRICGTTNGVQGCWATHGSELDVA